MKSFVVAIILALIFAQHIYGESSYPVGDARNCPTEQTANPGSPLVIMHAMPGLGFDGLRNIEMGQVYNKNYSTCQVSDNGYYLLPDDINLIPIHESEFDTSVEVFQHHYEHTSSLSASINVETRINFVVGHVSGRFSAEYLNTKKKMASTTSQSVRIGLRHHLYSVHINPDSQLHPSFKSRLMELASHIQNNDTQMAHYLSDLIVRDYGTHVVTSTEIGGALYQTGILSKNYTIQNDNMQLSGDAAASVRAGFIVTFSLNANLDFSKRDSSFDTNKDITTHVRVSTHGGPPFRMDYFNYTDWQNELPNNLVAIDRRGQLLSFAMTSVNFPELPDVLLKKTSGYIYKSIERYYETNTIKGCTDMNSPNFNFHANLEDNSCEKENHNYTFGGIYQTCEDHDNNVICNDYGANQVNPFTSDYSCPEGYESILLYTGTLSKMLQATHTYEDNKCKSYLFFFSHCKLQIVSSQHSEMRYSTYHAYWCYAPPNKEESPDSGYMFGGLYTSKTSNPVTRTSSCPPFYDTLHFGEDIKVCASRDDQAEENAIMFGGFYSCKSGNPLAITQDMYDQLENGSSLNQLEYGSAFPMECPHHYNQFLITIDEGCVVNYCSQFKDIVKYSPRPPLMPPYKMKPQMTVNKTESLIIFGPYGKIWVKDDDGSWFEYKNDSVIGSDYLQSLYSQQQNIAKDKTNEPPTNETSTVAWTVRTLNERDQTASSADSESTPSYTSAKVAGIIIGSVFSTALCIAFIAAVGCGVKKYKKKRIARKEAVLYLDKSETGKNETAVLIQDQD